MSGELAGWQATLPERSRYGIVQALRQTLGAAVRWGYMGREPGEARGPQPAAAAARRCAPTRSRELDAIAAELSPRYRPLPGVRRRDRAAARGVAGARAPRRRPPAPASLNVRRTVSSGEVVELGKTTRSRRQVPLSRRALAALDALPPRLDTPLLFPAPARRAAQPRQLPPPRVGAGDRGVRRSRRPARIYDLRSTFASNALAAGVTRVRAGAGDGHERRDDRAPLRHAARRRRGRDRAPPGRLRLEQGRR